MGEWGAVLCPVLSQAKDGLLVFSDLVISDIWPFDPWQVAVYIVLTDVSSH